jgi:hypothetical protein
MWIFRFHAKDGRRRDYGIGSTADYSLLQAREQATELRVVLGLNFGCAERKYADAYVTASLRRWPIGRC